jgi:hypothetical protein
MEQQKDIIQAFNKLGCKCSNNGYHLVDIHKWLMFGKNMLIVVYTNASGYLWERMDVVGGTHRADSGYSGPNEGGCWDSYEEALEAGIWEAYYLINN